MTTKTADEFYCKMGTLSGELLNGHLFDSNGLIQRIVDLGPIADLQKMREKHLFNITPWKDRRGLRFDRNCLQQRWLKILPLVPLNFRIFYSDDDVESEDETWKFMTGARRASLGLSAAAVAAAASATNRNMPLNDTRDRIALDISLLKKQYAKLRERQRQAHIILTNTAKQTVNSTANAPPVNVNQYLMGRNAIVSNKGRRIGPPVGAIPPARVSQPITAASKQQQKRFRNATIDNASPSVLAKRGNDDNFNLHKSPSVTSSMGSISLTSDAATTSAVAKKLFARKRSESSSYDEDSDNSQDEVDFGDVGDGDSSTDTSLCDEEVGNASSIEASPMKKVSSTPTSCGQSDESRCSSSNAATSVRGALSDSTCRKFSGSSTTTTAETKRSFDSENDPCETNKTFADVEDLMPSKDGSETESEFLSTLSLPSDRAEAVSPMPINDLDLLTLAFRQQITSTSQLSPIADIAKFLSSSSISPLKTPASCLLNAYPLCDVSDKDDMQTADSTNESTATNDLLNEFFKVNEEGVTNAYFERINGAVTERPSQLHLQSQCPAAAAAVVTTKLTPPQPSECTASDLAFKLSDVVTTPTACRDVLLPLFEIGPASIVKDVDELVKNEKQNFFKEKSISLDDAQDIGSNRDREIIESSGATSLPISCPETSNMSSKFDSSSKKTERILKIIEENSKILDRIMSKNAKGLAVGSGATISHTTHRTEELISFNEPKCSITRSDLIEPMLESTAIILTDTVGEAEKSDELVTELIESETKRNLIRTDVDDFLTDFLKKLDETNRIDKCIPASDDVEGVEEPSTVLEECDTNQSQIFDELLLDTVPQTVEEIIKQAMEKSSPIRSATVLDPSIENDLKSLLKMSAELLRDELPIISSVAKTSIENDSKEVSASEILSNAFLEFDDGEAVTIKGPDEDSIIDADADSTTGDISATISSIKNTIKSIDDLCQDDDRRSRERTDRTLNDIIKVVEQLEDDIRQKKHIEDTDENVPMTVPTIVEHVPRSDAIDIVQSGDENDVRTNCRYLSTSRMSRDRSRITSPRHRKGDDFGEFESRVRRSKSPAFLVSSDADSDFHPNPINNRYSDDFTKKYSLDAFKSQQIGDAAAKSSSLYKSNEKLEIRHTTVTSTFYDRFLSQKLEQQHKIDRSPSSPTITKAYLDTLKPVSFMSSSYPSAEPNSERRGSKSNENSPVRSSLEASTTAVHAVPPRSSFLLMPHLPYHTSIDRNSTYTRSCDNIPSNLNKPNVQRCSLFDSHEGATDYNYKRHSTAGAYSNVGSLPIKPKKPSELGIKLGLYEP